jgi:hypothetical protein
MTRPGRSWIPANFGLIAAAAAVVIVGVSTSPLLLAATGVVEEPEPPVVVIYHGDAPTAGILVQPDGRLVKVHLHRIDGPAPAPPPDPTAPPDRPRRP